MTTTVDPVTERRADGPQLEGGDESFWSRLGGLCFRRRRRVLAAWIGGLVVVLALMGTVGGSNESDVASPDSEAGSGFDVLDEHFGSQGTRLTGSIVFRADAGIDDPAVVDAMTELFDEVAAIPEVELTSPYSDDGQRQGQVATAGPEAGRIAYARLDLDADTGEMRSSEIGAEVAELADDIEVDGLRIEIGGSALGEFEPPESEVIGLAFAIVILILSFGSVLAMGLPIGVALFGVSIGAGLITLLSNVLSVPDFAVTVGAMIGLGVGIDYALFIVTRYRESIHLGMSPEVATMTAINTAGRAVVFAGFTVVISLLGMFVMGLQFINGLATGAAVTVLVTMLASVTLLPALIGFAGRRIEVTRWRGIIAAGLVSVALLGVGLQLQPLLVAAPLAVVVLLAGFAVAPLKRELPPRTVKPVSETVAYRWSHFIQRHPWPVALLTAAVLIVMTLPVTGMRLGFSDESNFPEESTTRQAYELIAAGFGAGANGPLLVVAETGGPQDLQAMAALTEAIAGTDGVAAAAGPLPSDPADPTASEAALIRVVPETGPQDAATETLVETLRTDVIPTAIGGGAGADLDVFVTGTVAAQIDFSDYLTRRLPFFFGAVLVLSFLLLMMVFRSLLVPLKAVVMNLLSIGGAYGLVVVIFQWGWGAELFNTAGGPIEPFIPMMMFAIVFGLSMDYEVFLLSRVKEEYDRTGDAANSVADGLATTARVITAAAAIMVVVFGSFVLEDNRIIKMMGVGLAMAVLLDASLVRMLLVPATMELLGDRNWWLPRWIDRILPTIHVEGDGHATSSVASSFEPNGSADRT